MAYATHTVGRQTTNAWPAWRQAMTTANRLYAFGNTPGTLAAKLVYPGGSAITNMDGGGDGTPEMQHRGWGSCWFLPDSGPFGRMLYQRTGEFTMENQISEIALSADSPTWEWWQQPVACLSASEAATRDADWYFNVSDWDAIKAATPNRIVAGASWGSWDGVFPVGLQESAQRGWIVRRKVRHGSFGDNVVSRARYDVHTTIPASWTGLGTSCRVINPHTLGGPHQSWQTTPTGATKAQWCEALGASGEKVAYLSFQRADTKAWSVAPVAIPDFVQLGSSPSGFVMEDSTRKRLYWLAQGVAGWGVWYADFSNGIAGMTTGGFTALTRTGPDFAPTDGATGGFTDGHPGGRRIFYWLRFGDTTNHLIVGDLDAGTITTLTGLEAQGLTWARTSGGLRPAFVYVPEANKMLMLEHTAADGLWLHQFAIPADPTSAAGYSFSKVQLTLDAGATLDQPDYMFGQRAVRIARLGNAIVLPQHSSRPLAFVPSI